MARNPERIEAEIDHARAELAATLDKLVERGNPQRLADQAKDAVSAKFSDPRVKYSLIVVGALLVLALLRKLFK